jgi:oxygen-independent coproporphyrinogen III oxidase
MPGSLYVHVPFCTRRCSYCDFAVQATRQPPVKAWLDAVAGELDLLARAAEWETPPVLDTIYVGGGTPSLLGADAMEELGRRLGRRLRWDDGGVEWTAEANPESCTPELAAGWRRAGINRISLGAQTFHEPALRWMGRLHGPDGPARAVATARAAGFQDVSLDLIFGLPGHLGRDWSDDLERALALEPQHVSLYGLTAEPRAPLGRWVAEGRVALADEDRYAEEYLRAHERLGEAGYEHYEVSNFGLPGFRSRHNQVYWTGAPYLALGPGAHAFDPPVRRWNLRDWDAYREAVSDGRLPEAGREVVTADETALERVWLGLRTSQGYPLAECEEPQRELARLWAQRGWSESRDGSVRLTAEGWLLLDRLAVEFAAAAGFA